MSEVKPSNYSRPPVEEAVFDLRIRNSNLFNEGLFKNFLKRNSEYHPHGQIQNVNIDTQTNNQNIDIIGYRCISKNQKHIVCFNKHGFSFSCLKVYDGWDKNYTMALELWNSYCEIMNPQIIVRTATRFINKFRIPEVFNSPKEYFNIYVNYDENISPAWTQMSNRLLLSHNNGIKSHIMFDSNINQDAQSVDVIFDIDVFSDITFPLGDRENLKKIFDQIRSIKNDIFEKCITDKIRDLIR